MPLFPRQAVKYLNNDLVSGLNISLPDLLSLPLPSRCVPFFFPSSYSLFSFLPFSPHPSLFPVSFSIFPPFFLVYLLFQSLLFPFFLPCLIHSFSSAFLAFFSRSFVRFWPRCSVASLLSLLIFFFVPFLHPFSFFACFFVFLPPSC